MAVIAKIPKLYPKPLHNQPRPLQATRSQSPSPLGRVPLKDITNLSRSAPDRTCDSNEWIPVLFQDDVRYDEKADVLICRICGYAVRPNFLDSGGHMKKIHNWDNQHRAPLLHALRNLPLIKAYYDLPKKSARRMNYELKLPEVPNGSPPIDGLAAPVSGIFPVPFCFAMLIHF